MEDTVKAKTRNHYSDCFNLSYSQIVSNLESEGEQWLLGAGHAQFLEPGAGQKSITLWKISAIYLSDIWFFHLQGINILN